MYEQATRCYNSLICYAYLHCVSKSGKNIINKLKWNHTHVEKPTGNSWEKFINYRSSGRKQSCEGTHSRFCDAGAMLLPLTYGGSWQEQVWYTRKNYELLKTGLNNVVLPILLIVVSNIEQVVEPESSPQSGVTMLNNIVDIIEQCGQHNIVQSCFQQPVTTYNFWLCKW